VIRRILIIAIVAWALGFVLFVTTLGKPLDDARKTDAIVVLTGGPGRIDRGLALLRAGATKHMLVSGVAKEVKPREFAAEYKVEPRLMSCCIELGHEAVDTASNADETMAWVRRHHYMTVRLVTADWHMPRARLELAHKLGKEVEVTGDPVKGPVRWLTLFIEYHKYLVRSLAMLFGIA
jgi:uncharacterized SAM-binding protein YcdF (DUF218 family)